MKTRISTEQLRMELLRNEIEQQEADLTRRLGEHVLHPTKHGEEEIRTLRKGLETGRAALSEAEAAIVNDFLERHPVPERL